MLMASTTNSQDASDTVLQLCCQACRRAFSSLEESFVAYALPNGNEASVTCIWIHRKCADGNLLALFQSDRIRMQRGDFALKALLTDLLSHGIPVAALKDWSRVQARNFTQE